MSGLPVEPGGAAADLGAAGRLRLEEASAGPRLRREPGMAYLVRGRVGGERLRRVSFYVPPGGRDLVLEQNSLLADFEQGGEPAGLVLARDVQLFQLEFWDGQQRDFVEEWLSTNQLPVIVRVTLGFGQPKGSREPAQIVSRVVRLPTVAVPREAQGMIGGAP